MGYKSPAPESPTAGAGGGGDSEQEGDDGHAQGRVVSELLQVAAVLALGPDGHLDEAHQGEEGHCRAETGSGRVTARSRAGPS